MKRHRRLATRAEKTVVSFLIFWFSGTWRQRWIGCDNCFHGLSALLKSKAAPGSPATKKRLFLLREGPFIF